MKVVDVYNVLDGLKLFHSWFSEVHLRPQSIQMQIYENGTFTITRVVII